MTKRIKTFLKKPVQNLTIAELWSFMTAYWGVLLTIEKWFLANIPYINTEQLKLFVTVVGLIYGIYSGYQLVIYKQKQYTTE